jgi:hypothetical protein
LVGGHAAERRLGMIHRTKLFLSIVSVLLVSGALGVAAAMRDDEQPLPAEAGDLAQAQAIEVRDAAGRVVLSGRFGEGEADDDDGDVERKADLRAAAGAARGEAEIELSGQASGTRAQELDVDLEGLPGGTAFTVHLDGRSVAALTTDERGRAEVKITSREDR